MSEYLVNNDNNRQQTNQSNNKQTGLNMGIKCKNDLYSIFSFCIMHVWHKKDLGGIKLA